MLNMERLKVVSRETVKAAYQGKFMQVSIHDSLELFFNKLRNQEIIEESVTSFFTPMLTEEEVQLVNDQNWQYLETLNPFYPNRHPEKMVKSDSNSKFVNVTCKRFTLPLNASRKRIYCIF